MGFHGLERWSVCDMPSAVRSAKTHNFLFQWTNKEIRLDTQFSYEVFNMIWMMQHTTKYYHTMWFGVLRFITLCLFLARCSGIKFNQPADGLLSVPIIGPDVTEADFGRNLINEVLRTSFTGATSLKVIWWLWTAISSRHSEKRTVLHIVQ